MSTIQGKCVSIDEMQLPMLDALQRVPTTWEGTNALVTHVHLWHLISDDTQFEDR